MFDFALSKLKMNDGIVEVKTKWGGGGFEEFSGFFTIVTFKFYIQILTNTRTPWSGMDSLKNR